ncbi:unnamed protein product [Brassica oleracea]
MQLAIKYKKRFLIKFQKKRLLPLSLSPRLISSFTIHPLDLSKTQKQPPNRQIRNHLSLDLSIQLCLRRRGQLCSSGFITTLN